MRFGIDPILSLIPGLGDLASPAFTVALFVQGFHQRIPRIVMARMALNAVIDALIGLVPIAGNIGDVFWRANLMNLALLERHAAFPDRPVTWRDYVFVWGIVILFVAAALVPVVAAWFIFLAIWRWLR